jgi:hypothetical protein
MQVRERSLTGTERAAACRRRSRVEGLGLSDSAKFGFEKVEVWKKSIAYASLLTDKELSARRAVWAYLSNATLSGFDLRQYCRGCIAFYR